MPRCRAFLRPLAVLATALLPAACADPPQSERSSMLVEQGRADYQRHCAVCHGLDGRGEGPSAAVLKTAPPDLTRIAARNGGSFPAGEVAAFIDGRTAVAAHGTREMPIWGTRLAEEEPPGELGQQIVRGRIDMIVDYLRTLQEAE